MAVLTRIQNNQITDSTIQAQQKLAAGSITGNLLASTVTFNSNITILGNLTVANSYTQLNSINTYINDPVVVFNNNYVGSLTNYDIGILVNRNLASLPAYGSVNTFLGWSESQAAFIAIATTETGTNVSSINNSGYANVIIGNLTASSSSITNNLTAGTITNSPISGSTGYFTTAQANNFSTANAIITNGYATTLEINNFSSPNVYVSGGYLQNLANVYATTGYFTNLSSPNLSVTGASVGTLYVTNFSTGNAVISGGYLQGLANVYATTGYTTNFSTGNAQITGGYADNFPIGANVQAPGKFTTLTTSGVSIFDGNLVLTANSDGLDNYTGSLVITGDGGLAVGGNINAGQFNHSVHHIQGNLLLGQGEHALSADTILTINLNPDAPIESNATVHLSGNIGNHTGFGADSFGTTYMSRFIGRHARGTPSAPSAVQANDSLAGFFGQGYGATGYTSGSVNPGMAVYAAQNFTDSAQATGLTLNYIPMNSTVGTPGVRLDPVNGGNLMVYSNTWSASPTSGALVVLGGIGVGQNSTFGANLTVTGNAIVQGNLTVNGQFEYINSIITTHVDPILELNTGMNGVALTVDNLADVGLKMHYYDTQDRVAFAGRAHDTGFLEYYAVGTESGNVISGTYGTIKGGDVVVANTTVSTSSSTGALRVSGGVGIAGALNVAQTVNGGNATFASINSTPIGNSSPSTGVFTTINATTITVPTLNATSGNVTTLYAQNFSSGNIQVTGGWLSGITNFNGTTGTIANFASANAVITGGSVDGSPIGASSASTGAFTTLTTTGVTKVGGNLVAGSGTSSTSTTTGALVVVGGAGVSGNVYAGGNFTGSNGLYSIGAFNGGYSDGIVIDYTSGLGRISVGASDGLTFYSGGPANTQTMSLDATGILTVAGNVVAASGTTSTSTTTGALVVTGGTGVSGNINVGGQSTLTGNVTHGNATTFNTTQTAGNDTIVKGVNDSTLIWARPSATYDQVLIGNSATVSTLVRGAKLHINTTDSIIIPTGTNAQRPSSVGGTDTQGMFRYNTTVNGIEWYTGTAWVAATTSFTVIADAQYTGDGSTTAFTLATAQTTASCIVSINGVVQIPTLAYSVSDTTLTFTEAPASTDVIDVRMLTTTATVTQISSTNGYMQFLVDNNGAYVYTGSVGTSPTTLWNTAGAEVNQVANVTATTTANISVDSFSPASYSSAEYLVTSTLSGTNIREISKILVVTDRTNAYRTVYGVTSTSGNTLTTWSANVYSGSVTLWATPTNANTIYRVRKNYQAN